MALRSETSSFLSFSAALKAASSAKPFSASSAAQFKDSASSFSFAEASLVRASSRRWRAALRAAAALLIFSVMV